MTGTLIPRYLTATRTVPRVAPTFRVQADNVQTSELGLEASGIRISTSWQPQSSAEAVNAEYSAQEYNAKEPLASDDKLYPHLFEGEAGEAMTYIDHSIEYTRQAIDHFNGANLEAVGTVFAQIAANMARAGPLTIFNESFGALVSFIRRATLCASGSDTSLPALNTLLSVLNKLRKNPAISLVDVGDLMDDLADAGWKGEFGMAQQLVAALFENNLEETDKGIEETLAIVKAFAE